MTALLGAAARADEGMWTFDNFPAAAVKAKYGVSIDRHWLDRVRLAAVRLSTGCSASLVSRQGLVLTNHHCVRDCTQDLSTAKVDYVRDGFSAARREDERLCPGLQAEILTGISDVTARVTAATAKIPPEGFKKARDAAIAAIEKESCAGREAKFRCQVVTLYRGGQYKLYTYRKYADVRLVFAPEQAMAFFGGDPDNFNFPRYDLDCSFVRLYESGKPVDTPNYLPWRNTGPKDGEPVFVAGNPGNTDRLYTAEQLEFLRDVQHPDLLLAYSEIRGRLIRFSAESPEHARTAEALLLGLENSFKARHGEWEALMDPALIATKRRENAALKARVAKDPALAAATGDPWSAIAKAMVASRRLYLPYVWTELRATRFSDLMGYARALARVAEERSKPNGERLPEYGESRLPLLEKEVLDPRPIYPEVEQVGLAFWLAKLRENLTADSPATKTFLGKESPESLAAKLAKSRLSDPAYRKQLWDGGMAAIRASHDPMIRFVLATDPASRAIRKKFEDEATSPVERATQKIAQARFAIYGTKTYPDATFSLRLAYGKVEGWTDNGVTVPPFTYYAGLWERATGEEPFKLPPRWVNAQKAVNPKTVLNFVSDADIVGGNSGSPAIDAQGRVIGAAFDGNIESLGGTFWFDDRVNRAVAVTTVAIVEALRGIYHNDALAAELKQAGAR